MYIEDMKKPVVLFEKFSFDEKRTEGLLKYLKNDLEWHQDVYNISGKEYKSPRLTSFFGDNSYTYTGQTKESVSMPKSIQYLAREIEKYLDLNNGYFNSCLLNWYRDGNDFISYHKDDEPEMDKEGVIAVMSVGAERKFYIKKDDTKEVMKFSLPNCSLAIMNPICQEEWKHSIPKENKIEESRISLTFRRFV